MVRNFWFDADIDGRESKVSGGPRAKDGGMVIDLFQRKEGEITKSFKIRCYEEREGMLVISIFNGEGEYICGNTTKR